MEFSESIAFTLHEEWRRTRLKEDGTYEPRWKTINDKDFVANIKKDALPSYLRAVGDGSYEIDIANACYTQLSADWQSENKAAAEVVAKMVESGKKMSKDEVGSVIHGAWLERNSWAKDGPLGVSFSELSKEEQYKDLRQYYVAVKMNEAKMLHESYGDLDTVIRLLSSAKKNGLNVKYNFNGNVLYSEFDNTDTCYVKVCGRTRAEQLIAEERHRREARDRIAKFEAQAGAVNETQIAEWIERGEKMIYPAKWEDWGKCVKGRASDLYHGSDLVNAMDVMEALHKGKSTAEATKIAEEANHSGFSWSMMMKIVTVFSKRGPEFYRANHEGEIDHKTEEFLQQLETENKQYETAQSKSESVMER